MALLGGKSGNTHWSKDYIEHLRTVHFALILASITGLLVALSPDVQELETAQRQLQEVRGYIQESHDVVAMDLRRTVESWWLTFEWHGQHYAGALDGSLDLIRSGVFSHCAQLGLTSRYKLRQVASLAKNLDEFRSFWNCASTGQVEKHDVVAFGDLGHMGFFGPQISVGKIHASGRDLSLQGFILGRFVAEEVEPVTLIPVKAMVFRNLRNLHLRNLFGANSGAPDVHASEKEDEYGIYRFTTVSDKDVNPWALVILQRGSLHDARVNENGLNLVKLSKCEEIFSKCFPELDLFVQDKATWTWDQLSSSLDTVLVQARSKQLELFGAKAPSAGGSLWVVAGIFTVMLYLLVHLTHLHPRLGFEDALGKDVPGLDVAWIGLYPSRLALMLVYLSTAVLPTMAVAVLAARSIHFHGYFADELAADRFFSEVVLFSVLCAGLSITCCFLMRRLALIAEKAREKSSITDPSADSAEVMAAKAGS